MDLSSKGNFLYKQPRRGNHLWAILLKIPGKRRILARYVELKKSKVVFDCMEMTEMFGIGVRLFANEYCMCINVLGGGTG